MQQRIQPILERYQRKIERAIRKGDATEQLLQGLFEEMRAALAPEIAVITTDRMMAIANEVGFGFDIAVLSEEAARFARDYSYELVRGITDTTRKLVSESVTTFTQTPGMTREDLERLLRPAFGDERAEMIAVTEVTRAYSAATNAMQGQLAGEGLPMVRQWNTLNDDLVCPICGPYHGAPESVWGVQFPDGPPAHVNCRCDTSLTLMTEEELAEEYGRLQAEREAALRELGLLE